jgi:hypothetical protein
MGSRTPHSRPRPRPRPPKFCPRGVAIPMYSERATLRSTLTQTTLRYVSVKDIDITPVSHTYRSMLQLVYILTTKKCMFYKFTVCGIIFIFTATVSQSTDDLFLTWLRFSKIRFLALSRRNDIELSLCLYLIGVCCLLLMLDTSLHRLKLFSIAGKFRRRFKRCC